jgi:hypothetical protein
MRVRYVLLLMAMGMALPSFAVPMRGSQATGPDASAAVAQPAKSTQAALTGPTVSYRKIFKGSTPEYVDIKIDRQGAGTYDIRQLDDTPRPQPFQVSSALTDKIFSLAADLHDFNGIQLNAKRLIANLGQKTFRYENGAESSEVTFNYTVNATANQLVAVFEGISLEAQYIQQLRSSMRYDPLGLDDELTRLQSDLASNAIAEPRALAPLLEQIASNQQFMDIARERARAILDSMGKVQ